VEIRSILVDVLEGVRRARELSNFRSLVEEYALRWVLYSTFQNLLDATAMIIADLRLRKPSSYSEMGRVLVEAGYSIDVEAFKLIATTRDMLAHAYRRLSRDELVGIIETLLPLVEKMALELTEVSSRAGVDPIEYHSGQIPEGVVDVFRRYNVILAYLFGSRARGDAREDSDYDIAVLTSGDVSIVDVIRLAVEIAEALEAPPDKIDVVVLNKADKIVKARILKEGKLIYTINPNLVREWEKRSYMEILDNRDLDAVYMKRVLERAQHIKVHDKPSNQHVNPIETGR